MDGPLVERRRTLTGAHTTEPHRHNVDCLSADLQALGLRPDHDVLVHCAMSQIGWIQGGASALVRAIHRVAGSNSTVVVPTQTTINSPTSRAFRNATSGMSQEQVAVFTRQLSGFALDSPALGMGRLAEYMLNHEHVVRSSHPLVSFAAIGPRAEEFMAVHDLESHLGERSPVSALYEADASILMLGVGYEVCSALHLAEYRLPRPPMREYSCFVVDRGQRVLRRFSAINLDDSDFAELGDDFDVQTGVQRGLVGNASSRTMRVRHAVDFAVGWLTENRPAVLPLSDHRTFGGGSTP